MAKRRVITSNHQAGVIPIALPEPQVRPVRLNGLPDQAQSAFPVHLGSGMYIPGLTLWDYFFTHAFQALATEYRDRHRSEWTEAAAKMAGRMMEVRREHFAAIEQGDQP